MGAAAPPSFSFDTLLTTRPSDSTCSNKERVILVYSPTDDARVENIVLETALAFCTLARTFFGRVFTRLGMTPSS